MSEGAESLEKVILRKVGRAIADFQMIQDRDRIMVGLSGGKDSWTLLHLLKKLQKKAPVQFSVLAVNIDAGYPDYNFKPMEDYLQEKGWEYRIEKTNIYQVIRDWAEERKNPCAFCARLRRGHLYRLAKELKCNKIALAHHLDDLIETLLLSQFYIGLTSAMSPKLYPKNERTIVLIRPLVYLEEKFTVQYAELNNFPIIEEACSFAVCRGTERLRMKKLISELEKDIPKIKKSLLSAMSNIRPTHLLDKRLMSFM